MIDRGRLILFAAFGGLGAILLGLVLFAQQDNPDLSSAQIKLVDVQVQSIDKVDKRASLKVVFEATNPSQTTFTVSDINYKLLSDGTRLGQGHYSKKDVPLPARPALYPDQSVKLEHNFQLIYNERIDDIYNRIVQGEKISYSADGVMTVESAWSVVEKPFNVDEMQHRQ